MTWEVREGDCLDAMAEMPEGSVDAIVTDPPYGINFMGKEWDGPGGMLGQIATGKERRGAFAYGGSHSRGDADNDNTKFQEWCLLWATQALRVLKPGGYLLAFGGTRTYHRLACGIEDAGFEVRDCLAWAYGSGFPKSHNLDGEWQGWGTALKPAYEPVILARKPLTGTVAANVQEYGTGALNIDGGRIPAADKTKFPGGGYSRHESDAAYEFGGDPNFTTTGKDAHPSARWPANLILDESAGAMLDAESGREVSRFFYCPKASKAERNAGLDGFDVKRPDERDKTGMGTFDEKGVQPQRNAHPTVKPIDLMRYLVRLVTPPGGTVLDPFTGSGTTGIAAGLEGFDFIGIEREAEYREIAEARLKWWADKDGEAEEPLTLFGKAA